jgi:formylglycine-generating enzyme required for sulfatase activity
VPRRLALLVVCAFACGGERNESAGEVLVVVDTDMPVPAFVSRLRIDLYAPDGTWYATHDVVRARQSDWPTSFGVSADDAEHVALVRVRAYAEGKVRDYRGERFMPRPTSGDPLSPVPQAPPSDQPRLLSGESDVTPPSEPEPLLAIDRLLRIRTRPRERSSVRVVLRGACVGTMADVAHAMTCIDREDVRVAATEESSDESPTGSFGAIEPCTAVPRPASPLHDDEACVDGATFLLGSNDWVFYEVEDRPERITTLTPFRIDRWEVTVARWRAAVAAGFTSPDATPTPNEGPLSVDRTKIDDPTTCTWSATVREREDFAISCVSHAAARAFCRWAGGDLPSEAQWEYVAALAGRPYRTRFAWGGDDDATPSCQDALWGRGENVQGQLCRGDGFGPLAVDARAMHDRSIGLGLIGLAGGIAERARDAVARLDTVCWARSGIRDPGCDVAGALHHTIRGASWHDNVLPLRASARRSDENFGTTDATSDVGFRCVRPGR